MKYVIDVQERREVGIVAVSRRFTETDSRKAFKIAMDAERAGFKVAVAVVRGRERVEVAA